MSDLRNAMDGELRSHSVLYCEHLNEEHQRACAVYWMNKGARLALEALPCRQDEEFGKPCVLVIGPGSMCGRCRALASLNPSGEG